MASCPLCGHTGARSSWLGGTHYAGMTYAYLECAACRSLRCHPMPDAKALAQMYGVGYQSAFEDLPGMGESKQPDRVLHWLDRLPRGTFVDYGCGDGALLCRARALGWVAQGVELDAEVARCVEAASGNRVVCDVGLLPPGSADVVHLGDVVEHLTDPLTQVGDLTHVLRPGGLLIAQGPLEANPNLFVAALRIHRSLRGAPPSAMAPYHVTLATLEGQRAFFERLGLIHRELAVSEVDWPAPSRLSWSDAARPRSVALFVLRRVSRAITRLRPAVWGNRYFYAGEIPAK